MEIMINFLLLELLQKEKVRLTLLLTEVEKDTDTEYNLLYERKLCTIAIEYLQEGNK